MDKYLNDNDAINKLKQGDIFYVPYYNYGRSSVLKCEFICVYKSLIIYKPVSPSSFGDINTTKHWVEKGKTIKLKSGWVYDVYLLKDSVEFIVVSGGENAPLYKDRNPDVSHLKEGDKIYTKSGLKWVESRFYMVKDQYVFTKDPYPEVVSEWALSIYKDEKITLDSGDIYYAVYTTYGYEFISKSDYANKNK